jgi:ABC-type glutathione transport system ATPase component
MGPSGAGKTSLLDVISGLRTVASGRVAIDDDVLVDTAASIRLREENKRAAVSLPIHPIKQCNGIGSSLTDSAVSLCSHCGSRSHNALIRHSIRHNSPGDAVLD